jgi:selenocysteine lyase/cysteine desulfurase
MSLNINNYSTDLVSDDSLIHFNNAGASLMPKAVLDCQIEHLKLEAIHGGYEAAALKSVAITEVYNSVAKLINCQPQEVALVENATIGWVCAFQSIPFRDGDTILTAQSEYGSNYLSYLKLKEQVNVNIEIIPSTASGEICLEALADMLDSSVKLISITHIPTNGGLVNPIEAIGKLARQHNILYLVDACQTAGQLPIDVERIGCDFLSATGRKYLRGPRGSGFLYVKKSIIEQLKPPMIDVRSATWTDLDSYQLRADATRFENWENNYSALLGLGCAIDYALDIGLAKIAQINKDLATELRNQLSNIEGVVVQDIGSDKCAIVSFCVAGIDAQAIVDTLRKQQINTSCSRPSSTLIDAKIRDLPDLVRASLHYFNTRDQITTFCQTLSHIISSTLNNNAAVKR